MMKFQYTEDRTQVLLMKLLWSRLQRDREDLGKHNFHTLSLKTEISRSVKLTKITMAPCRKTQWAKPYLEPQMLVT